VSRRGALSVLALTALAPFLAACGGGSKNAAEPLPTAPTLTVPGESKAPRVTPRANRTTTNTSTTTTPTTTPTPAPTTTTQTTPAAPSGGAAAPQTGGASPPDTQQNDQAPPAGSPASKFEQFCKDNPGAC
jgi:hypothetical protein